MTQEEKSYQNEDGLFRIIFADICYGVDIKNNTIVRANPLARWMLGESFDDMRVFVHEQGGVICRGL